MNRRPFSAALCRGLIEATKGVRTWRRYIAFSAALCRGLIEAFDHPPIDWRPIRRFPRLYAAASLKHEDARGASYAAKLVFRGFMPRPH